jgi:hypothetical protein
LSAQVPVSISGNVPITVGYNLAFDVCAEMTAAASIHGNITHGLVYNGTVRIGYRSTLLCQHLAELWVFCFAQGFYTEHTNTLAFHEPRDPAIDANAAAHLTLWVEPVLNVIADYIGGPSITARAQADIGIDAGSDACGPNIPGLAASGSWGLALALSAGIHINLRSHHIFDLTWGPRTVYGPSKHPLFAGCLEHTSGSWRWVSTHSSSSPGILLPKMQMHRGRFFETHRGPTLDSCK